MAPATGTSALYFQVANGTQAEDTLRAVRTPAGAASLHETYTAGDSLMGMRAIDHVAVPPRTRIAFAPGGRHVMLKALAQPLQPGDTLVATFVFAQSDTQRVQVPVRQSAPPAP